MPHRGRGREPVKGYGMPRNKTKLFRLIQDPGQGPTNLAEKPFSKLSENVAKVTNLYARGLQTTGL